MAERLAQQDKQGTGPVALNGSHLTATAALILGSAFSYKEPLNQGPSPTAKQKLCPLMGSAKNALSVVYLNHRTAVDRQTDRQNLQCVWLVLYSHSLFLCESILHEPPSSDMCYLFFIIEKNVLTCWNVRG